MRNLTKDNITEAFVKYFNKKENGTSVNPRTMAIMASLANPLHAFALETKLTHEEWNQGVDFLKRVGKKTIPERDEVVLLSDILGLSSLIDMIHNNRADGDAQKPPQTKPPTSSSVLGPFHLSSPPKYPMGTDLKRSNDGELVLVQGKILDSTTGAPISGATVNVWQTASNGMYSSQDPEQDTYNFHGILASTGEDGIHSFTTSKPVPYQIPTDGPVGELLQALGRHAWRPSHLHYIVQAEGYKPPVQNYSQTMIYTWKETLSLEFEMIWY